MARDTARFGDQRATRSQGAGLTKQTPFTAKKQSENFNRAQSHSPISLNNASCTSNRVSNGCVSCDLTQRTNSMKYDSPYAVAAPSYSIGNACWRLRARHGTFWRRPPVRPKARRRPALLNLERWQTLGKLLALHNALSFSGPLMQSTPPATTGGRMKRGLNQRAQQDFSRSSGDSLRCLFSDTLAHASGKLQPRAHAH